MLLKKTMQMLAFSCAFNRKKYSYAEDITYEEVIESVRIILNTIWDPDYTKLTKEEEASMLAAEASGFVNEDEIDWDKIGLN